MKVLLKYNVLYWKSRYVENMSLYKLYTSFPHFAQNFKSRIVIQLYFFLNTTISCDI